jgi:hypothetical protein
MGESSGHSCMGYWKFSMFVYLTTFLLLDDFPTASGLWGEHGSDTGMNLWLYMQSAGGPSSALLPMYKAVIMMYRL